MREFLASLLRVRSRRSSGGKAPRPNLDLKMLDLRNPPSDNITSSIVPLAVTAAAVAAEVYYIGLYETSESNRHQALDSTEAAIAANDERTLDIAAAEAASVSSAPGPGGGDVSALGTAELEARRREAGSDAEAGGSGDAFGEGDVVNLGAGVHPVPLDYGPLKFPKGGGGGWDALQLPTALPAAGPTLGGPGDPSQFMPFALSSGNGSITSPVIATNANANNQQTTSPVTTSGSSGSPGASSTSERPADVKLAYSENLSELPVTFVSNAGQWGSGVDFSTQRGGLTTWITPNAAILDLAQPISAGTATSTAAVTYDQISFNWNGINPNVQGVGEGQLDSVSNYLLGNNPADWYSNVAEYSSVRYANAWPGIDLVYQQSAAGALEYTFDLQPGADVSAISFEVTGAKAKIVHGDLVLTTPAGTVLTQAAPIIYQVAADGNRQAVSGGYIIRADGSIGFAAGKYNASLPLTIDPIPTYSATIWSETGDTPLGITMDSSGDAIAVGWSSFAFLTTTVGAYQTTFTGSEDAYIIKLGPTGSVIWATYLGGNNDTQVSAVALGSDDSVYLTGNTTSTNFPTTTGAYQTSLAGTTNAFLTRLSSSGSSLVSSTYLGGSGSDYGTGLALNTATGQAVVVGSTTSSNFPTTQAYQSSQGGSENAFITEFNATGTGLVYSSYLGGSSSDSATGVALDSSGDAFMVGKATSSNFPTTNAYDTAISGSSSPFVSEFGPTGSLTASTYIGVGTTANAVAVDSAGDAYVVGNNSGSDYLVKFTNFATQPAYTQSIAASAYAVSVDSSEEPVVVGATTSGVVAVTSYSADGSEALWTGTWGSSTTGYGGALDPMGDFVSIGGSSTGATVEAYTGMGTPAVPVITGFTPNNGSGITTSATPTLSGTAPDSSTVTIYRQGPADPYPESVGTTTATTSGTWSYTYPSSLGDAVYYFTATATVSSLTSPSSAEFPVTVETGAPAISIAVVSQTYDTVPEVVVTASDIFGMPSSPLVTLNLDAADDGDFSALATATLVNGAAVFDSYSALTVGTTVQFDAEVANLAGTVGTSSAATVYVQDPGWSLVNDTPLYRSGYGGMAGWSSPQDGLVYAGDVVSSPTLNLGVSAISEQEQPQALVYNSQQADPAPTVQVVVESNNSAGLPTSVTGTLTWDGVTGATINYDISALTAGGNWVFGAAAPSSHTGDGIHTYTLSLVIHTSTEVEPLTASGYTFVANSTASPYGVGWSFQSTDRLVTIASDSYENGGMLREFGAGGWAFYQNNLSSGGYYDPYGDEGGALVTVAGGGWKYTASNGSKELFDNLGRMTNWISPSGFQTFTYAYSGSSDSISTVTGPDGAVATFTYSGSGYLTQIAAPGSRLTTFAYNSSHDLTLITDAAGGLHTYSYSAANELTGEMSGLMSESFGYDTAGLAVSTSTGLGTTTFEPGMVDGIGTADEAKLNLTYVIAYYYDPLGNLTKYWYNSYGQEMVIRDPLGALQTYERDVNGYITQYTDAMGNTTDYTVNSVGQITSETRPDGSSATWDYTGSGYNELTVYTDFDGSVWTYAYDSYGELTASTDPDKHTTTYTWSNGLLSTMTDPLLNVTTYQYDAALQLTGTLLGGQSTGITAYDSAGNPTAFTDPLGNQTTYAFDGVGRVTSMTDPMGNVTTYDYDTSGLLLYTTDPLGRVTSYGYDSAGNETVEVDAYGTSFATRTTYVYDIDNRLVATVNALGQRTTTVYLGSVVGSKQEVGVTIDAMGFRTTNVYNLDGEVTQSMNARGEITKYAYDLLGRLTAVTDPEGNTTDTYYDGNSNVTATVDGRGNTTTYDFDPAGNETVTIDPLGNRTTTAYDADNRVTATTDPDQHTTTIQYDSRGRVTSTEDAALGYTTYVYDAADRLTSTIDPRGNTTTYFYNHDSEVTAILDPLNNITTTLYDKDGEITTSEDAGQNITTYSYDPLGRVTTTEDALHNLTTSQYNAINELTATVDARGNTISYDYNADGYLINSIDPLGNKTTYGFDQLGNETVIVDPLGNRTTYVYNADGLQTKVINPLGDTTVTGYDADGDVTAVTDARGYTTTYVYDADDRLTAMEDAETNRTTYGYDAASNLITVTDPNNHTTTTSYNALNLPTAVEDALKNITTYQYDADENLTSTIDARGYTTTYDYSADNQLTAMIDATGATTTYKYNAAGDLTMVTDPDNHVTSYAYNADNMPTAMTDGMGNVWTTQYDADGDVTATADPRNETTTISYNADDQPTATMNPLSQIATIAYDNDGRVWVTIDPLGNRTTTLYDGASEVARVTDALKNVTAYAYDADGNQTLMVDPLGNTTTYIYDPLDRLTATVDPLGNRSTVLLDAAGNVTVSIDPRLYRTTYAYDADNRLTTTTDALLGVSTIAYDADGNVTATTDQNGNTTDYTYNAADLLSTTTDPMGNVTTQYYDAAGNVTAVTDPKNLTTDYYYDAENRLTMTKDPVGNVTTSVYNSLGLVSYTVDALNGTTTYDYNKADELTSVTDPLNNITTTSYDAAGNVTAVEDARGFTTTYQYDADNRPTTTIDALNNRTTTVYDADGNVVATVDALGDRTTTLYDADGQPTTTIDALSHRTTTAYDADGNVTAVTDPLNRTTTYAYDALDRMTTTTDPLKEVTTVAYDAVGNETSMTDADSNVTTWSYNADNLVTKETDPNSSTITYLYDKDSELTSMTDQDHRVTTYAYDNDGNLTGESWFNSSGTLTELQTWAYDAAGDMTIAAAPAGTYTMSYKAADLLTSVQEPFGLSLTFGYDADYNRTSVQDSTGGLTTVGYDKDDRETSVQYSDSTAGIASLSFDYAYNARGDVTSVTDYSNSAGTSLVATTTYKYDAADRLTNEKQTGSSGLTVLANYTYSYDAANELTSKDENGTTTTYAYNADSELTADGSTSYSYDATGNRTNSGYSTTQENELSTDGTYTYSYDSAGNVTQETEGSNGPTWVYTYNNANQLVGASYSATPGGTVTEVVTYSYDAFGNRIEEDLGNGSSTTSETRFGVDGWSTASPMPEGNENFNDWVDLNGLSSNAVEARRIFGLGFDNPVASPNSSTVDWYLTDNEGSVRQVINNADTVLASATYSAMGVVTTGSLWDRYGFQGMQWDSTLGLYYDDARMLDVSTGRFMSQDPTGFGAGSPNLYEFAGNGPTNASDPSGDALTGNNLGSVGGNAPGNPAPGNPSPPVTTPPVSPPPMSPPPMSPPPMSPPPMSPPPTSPPVSPPPHSPPVSPPPVITSSPLPPAGSDTPRGGVTVGPGNTMPSTLDSLGGLSFDFIPGSLLYQSYNLLGLLPGSLSQSFNSQQAEPYAAGLVQGLSSTISPVFNSGLTVTQISGPSVPTPTWFQQFVGLFNAALSQAQFVGSPGYYAQISHHPSTAHSYQYPAPQQKPKDRPRQKNDSWYAYLNPLTFAGKLSSHLASGALHWAGDQLTANGYEAGGNAFTVAGNLADAGEHLSDFLASPASGIALLAAAESGRLNQAYTVLSNSGQSPLEAGAGAVLFGFADLSGMTKMEQAYEGTDVFTHEPLSMSDRITDAILGYFQFALTVDGLFGAIDGVAGLASSGGRLPVEGEPSIPGRPQGEVKPPVVEEGIPPGKQSPSVEPAKPGGPVLSNGPCFVAGTPLLVPGGSKLIEHFVPGDFVLSRDENDPDSAVMPKMVEEVFRRTGKILELKVGRQTIRTTTEHPFWVLGKGWLPASQLMAGDRLVSHNNEPIVVTEIVDTGLWEVVYNVRIADFHTYFVGCEEWGFSVWAHNAPCVVETSPGSGRYNIIDPVSKKILKADLTWDEAQAELPNYYVNLTDATAQTHILDGDATGGGHRPGTGIPGKSEFPSGWSDAKILDAISEVATDPNVTWSLPDSRGYITATKTIDGIDVKVVWDTRNGRIVTGYPTNVPRNP
jgi:RHS repeat-associated protein